MGITNYFVGIDGSAYPIKSNGRSPLFNAFHGIDTGGEELQNSPEGHARAYSASSIVWRCINVRSRTFASLPLVFMTPDEKPLPNSHPFAQALNDRRSRLWKATAKDMDIWGKAYWLPVNQHGRIIPRRLNPLTMEIDADKNGVQGFKQRIDGQLIAEYEPGEIIYFFDYDPKDDFGSISPTQVALRSIGVDISLETFVKAFFDNSATPAGLLSTEQRLQDADAEMYRSRWERLYKGVVNSFKVAVMGQGLSYQTITPLIKDLMTEQLSENASRKICQAYDTPLTIALATDAANFATSKEQHQSFYEEGVLPFADMILDEVNLQFAPLFGEVQVRVAKDEITVLQEDQTEITQRATQGFQGGIMTLNEARDLENLPAIEGGNKFLIGGQLVSTEDVASGNTPKPSAFPFLNTPKAIPAMVIDAVIDQAANELKQWEKKASSKKPTVSFAAHYVPSAIADFIRMDLAAGKDVKAIFEAARAHLKQDDAFATPEEFENYWQGIGELYNQIAAAIVENWQTVPERAAVMLRETGSIDYNALLSTDDVVNKLVGSAENPGVLTAIFLAGAARGNDILENNRLSANPSKAALTIAWDIVNQAALSWARDYGYELVRGINETTQQAFQESISSYIESGEHLDNLADAIEGKLSGLDIPAGWSPKKIQWATSPERAALIAQTETTRAFHEGVTQRWEQAGVNKFRWRTQNDPTVCTICKGLNNQVGDLRTGIKGSDGKDYRPPAHPGCRCFGAPED